MEPATSLSACFDYLYDLTKKFLVSDAVSDYICTPFDLTKKFLVSDAVSDYICTPFDLTKKFLVSDAVSDYILVSARQWCERNKVPIIAVVVIVLLFRCCGGGNSKSGKTMKAPGRNSRIRRSHFEANPSAYFRNLHKGR
ncbi:hypothetical protein OIU74_024484 [Salix koriyanagi]|uniref:Uncharacterized protein n=1 Tax=Salix koriyanagi TaxID=2511006 RepID=A0A9Q1A8H7_9ROSI|nr:hypothetical protein OIU74_024484 [Salix koriyanagi]